MYYKQNVKKRRKSCCNQQGFSLIELAVVLLVIGVILGGAAGMVAPYIESSHHKATQKKLERIAQSLALFAQSYYTVPCPAVSNPSGESLGMPQNTASPFRFVSGSCTTGGATPRGIVPFRVLGLTEDDVKDAYGNYITYMVSNVFDQYRASLGDRSVNNFEVHRNCLSAAWKTGDKMWNMDKAKFCCPKPVTGYLQGYATATKNDYTKLLDNTYNRCANNIRAWNTGPVTSTTCTVVDEPETMAFVLISHGKNGYGAYLRDGTRKPLVGLAAAALEAENVTPTNSFVDRTITYDVSGSGASYFDDIVLWRTNHQLISAFGNDSCDYP